MGDFVMLSQRLRALRSEMKMTQKEFAEKRAGFSPFSIYFVAIRSFPTFIISREQLTKPLSPIKIKT